jgi:hypothetical protein
MLCIDKCVCRVCHVRARDVSTRVCFNVSKTRKSEHGRLRHVTRLARRVRRVRIYTCLARVNTCSTYKFNKIQNKINI